MYGFGAWGFAPGPACDAGGGETVLLMAATIAKYRRQIFEAKKAKARADARRAALERGD